MGRKILNNFFVFFQNTELTFDYNLKYETGKTKCLCKSEKCAGYIGAKYIDKEVINLISLDFFTYIYFFVFKQDKKTSLKNIAPRTKKTKKINPKLIKTEPIDITEDTGTTSADVEVLTVVPLTTIKIEPNDVMIEMNDTVVKDARKRAADTIKTNQAKHARTG